MTQMTISDLIRIIGGAPDDIAGDPGKIIRAAMPFDQATDDAVAFVDTPKLFPRIKDSRAGAVIVPRQFSESVEINLIYADNPRLAFARVMHRFHPRTPSISGIHPMAVVGAHLRCGENTVIGPFVYIGNDVKLGERVVIHPHAYIGDGVHIGDDTEIFPNVSILEKCRIGRRVIINAGTVVGSEGFGFTPDGGKHFKIPQVGIVQIDDDVEIGACNTIDRATFGRTWIQEGVKTDNLVQIAHNVTIGAHTIIVAQVGIAGSTEVGKHVILAGQAGIAGHISIGDGTIVGPQAGVARSVPPGQTVSGTPEMPHRQWLKSQQVIPRLPEMKKQIAQIDKRLKSLEKNMESGDDSGEGSGEASS